MVMVTFAGQEIHKSPFEINVGPYKETQIRAYGPGLLGGVVNYPALFTVETHGETGALGIYYGFALHDIFYVIFLYIHRF